MSNHEPPIKGFIEKSSLAWPGQVCAVVLLPYCNLRCPYCYTHQLVLEPHTLPSFSLNTILEVLHPQKDALHGVCITGGEPTIQWGLPGLLRRIREAGFRTKVDTNGTQPEVLEHLIENQLVDAVAMDVKAPLEEAPYQRCAGVYTPISIIEKSIKVLTKTEIPSEFRCTVVPSLLAEEDLYRLAEQIKDIAGPEKPSSLTLQNFDPSDTMETSLQDVRPHTEGTLSRMQATVNGILR
jgi:pyruvate formate lyase activating enzyme